MSWLALFRFLVSLALQVAKYLSDKQLLEAGEARAFKALMEDANERVNKAREAREHSHADSDDGGLLDDDGHRID